jgi:predicted unusual protein kinase regulating ubiquinone biosynthesis (AarF/ABC1/UbiB family)
MTEDIKMTDDIMPERNTRGSRVARYAKVSTTMAGLAAKVAGEKYFGVQIDRDDHAKALMESLGNLKGPLMKIGQILATIPEALPPEYAKAFQELQSNAPPMGWPFVKRRMKTELGADWETKFATFERDSSAAASLGQVHRATLLDGRTVACKLQYPDMQSAIEADLKQLKVIFGLFERVDKVVSTKYIHDELSERLREELDYELESKFCAFYKHTLHDEKTITVPEVITTHSTPRLLTSEWLDGRPLMSYIDAPVEQRNEIAMNMFRAWYVPLSQYGAIHGDPHLGNYSIRPDNGLNLLDFGCVRIFPPQFVHGVIELYNALLTDDLARSVAAYETWGFKDLNKEQIETLNIWARFLYGPLMDDRVRKIGEVTNGIYGRETAEQVHKKLREVGGITVPREFVFMDRAALSLGSVFLHLKAEVNWYQLFNELIQDFDVDALHKRQTQTLIEFNLPQYITK